MNKKVLLIDDDADDRLLFCEAMEEVAPQVNCSTYGNARVALSNLAQEETLPDLIFLDVNMPIMNGWQCLAALKEEPAYRPIPVIMYSTSSHQEDVERVQEYGALCFFTKPSNFRELKKGLALIALHLMEGTLSRLVGTSPLFLGAVV